MPIGKIVKGVKAESSKHPWIGWEFMRNEYPEPAVLAIPDGTGFYYLYAS